MRFSTFIALTALFIPACAYGAIYSLSDEVYGPGFYSFFEWEAIEDPTHGRVTYVDKPTSIHQNLTYATSDTFILRTDFKTVLDPNGPGRNSVRIRSKKTYTSHVAVFDVRHIPQGCGTWPAIWETLEANWPNGGEIDIMEGVNDQGTNQATLHTSPDCLMPTSRTMAGTPTYDTCDVTLNFNAGCGVKFPTASSFGPAFNTNGGGWYAMERSQTYFKIWFWSRNDCDVPSDVAHARSFVNPDAWGTPTAYFPNTFCDFSTHFDPQNIIINLTLCGDWAGSTYSQGTGCPLTCVDHVNYNASAFTDAYFDFASIRVYQDSRKNNYRQERQPFR